MGNFFLSPIEPPNWEEESSLRIRPHEYTKVLKEQWEDTTIIYPGDSKFFHLKWTLSNGLDGELQENEQVVVIYGSPKAVAEFALWHRSIISDRYELYLFHESLYFTLELTKETKYQEIVDVIG